MTTAGKPAAIPRAAAPAWVVVDLEAVVEVHTPAVVAMAVVDTINHNCHQRC
jgi:hypothetical protein